MYLEEETDTKTVKEIEESEKNLKRKRDEDPQSRKKPKDQERLEMIEELKEHRMVLMPLKGKKPILKDWTNLTFDQTKDNSFDDPKQNFGILTGKKVVSLLWMLIPKMME